MIALPLPAAVEIAPAPPRKLNSVEKAKNVKVTYVLHCVKPFCMGVSLIDLIVQWLI